jgi:hypothetical protein
MENHNLKFLLLEQVARYFASKISYEVLPDAPSTLEECTAYYREHGRLAIWQGGSENTIYSDAAGNYAFRAWHDWIHVKNGFTFDADGEEKTFLAHCRDVEKLDWLSQTGKNICFELLRIEIIGQLEYEAENGSFPENQKDFMIERLG